MKKNIGFISTRFAGTDGVTLEASKWAQVLRSMDHSCYWLAGKLDKHPTRSMLVPEAFFQHEKNLWINERILGRKRRDQVVTDTIQEVKNLLKQHIRDFIHRFDIHLIIPQNALTIPMHVPLGMAITEIIAETQIPTIAHHHDFYWERTRFMVNAVYDYLRMAFPPNLPGMEHIVINSAAQEELALRTGISSIIVPNILDFLASSRRIDCPLFLRLASPLVENTPGQFFRRGKRPPMTRWHPAHGDERLLDVLTIIEKITTWIQSHHHR